MSSYFDQTLLYIREALDSRKPEDWDKALHLIFGLPFFSSSQDLNNYYSVVYELLKPALCNFDNQDSYNIYKSDTFKVNPKRYSNDIFFKNTIIKSVSTLYPLLAYTFLFEEYYDEHYVFDSNLHGNSLTRRVFFITSKEDFDAFCNFLVEDPVNNILPLYPSNYVYIISLIKFFSGHHHQNSYIDLINSSSVWANMSHRNRLDNFPSLIKIYLSGNFQLVNHSLAFSEVFLTHDT